MLSPTKGFIKKHHALVDHVVVQALWSTDIPIRVSNHGATPVTLKKEAMVELAKLLA